MLSKKNYFYQKAEKNRNKLKTSNNLSKYKEEKLYIKLLIKSPLKRKNNLKIIKLNLTNV